MIILKSETFGQESDVVKFVNLNNIKRENILEITATVVEPNLYRYIIFFYGDSETKEITRGFFGW
jgi:hypothetical protein